MDDLPWNHDSTPFRAAAAETVAGGRLARMGTSSHFGNFHIYSSLFTGPFKGFLNNVSNMAKAQLSSKYA
jgi:hypothetical protein